MPDVIEIPVIEVITVDETSIEVITVGVQGPPGPQGLQGLQGIQGEQGPQGDPATNLVTSVAGKTGAVALAKGDVGLGNVDNTSDADKPVSTAQQAALGGKADFPTSNQRIPVRGPSGEQTSLSYTTAASASSLAFRTNTGTLKGATATATDELTTKAQMDTADALKVAKTGDTMTGQLNAPSYRVGSTALILSGTGFPNSVVTAPVGSTYIDTNATSGAVEWKKATGTGNTGWVVSMGDTGWRQLSTILENGWVGSIYIRRINGEVRVSAGRYSFTGAAATSDTFYTLPSGFRSTGIGNFSFIGVGAVGSAIPTQALVSITRNTYLLGSSARNELSGEWSYLSADAWPTTLPGTAA